MFTKKLIFSLLLSLTAAAFAQDISGTYTGTLKTELQGGQPSRPARSGEAVS